jgi:hypothetical protein
VTDPDSPFSSRERIAAADIADDHARLKRACYALLDDLAPRMMCPVCGQPVGHHGDCPIGKIERALGGAR